MKVFDINLKALEKDMGFRLKRQNLIASNLANVDTPGFQAKDLQFDEALKGVYEGDNGHITSHSIELDRTDNTHMEYEDIWLEDEAESEIHVVQAPGIDENGVDLDREMSRMAENNLMYSASSIALKKKMGMLKYAIQEGGR